jgi:hypothetical protein
MLVPASPNASAVTSAIPGAQAMPAGLPAAAYPTTTAVPTTVIVEPSNVSPYSWEHADQNDSDWAWDHGG